MIMAAIYGVNTTGSDTSPGPRRYLAWGGEADEFSLVSIDSIRRSYENATYTGDHMWSSYALVKLIDGKAVLQPATITPGDRWVDGDGDWINTTYVISVGPVKWTGSWSSLMAVPDLPVLAVTPPTQPFGEIMTAFPTEWLQSAPERNALRAAQESAIFLDAYMSGVLDGLTAYPVSDQCYDIMARRVGRIIGHLTWAYGCPEGRDPGKFLALVQGYQDETLLKIHDSKDGGS